VHEFAVLNSDIEEIKIAINKLKKDYQDVIIWHYLDDLSAQEIAEILEKPAGTIRVMIHRGLQMLREILEGKS
jgi:RNA polymerase sigma-70 factor (ECF subfamily)